MNSLTPLGSLLGAAPSGGSSPGLGGFESVLRSASGAAPDATGAKLQWLNAEYQKQQTLFSIFSPSSSKGSTSNLWSWALQDLTAPGGALALPGWAYDLERLTGDGLPHSLIQSYSQAQSSLASSFKPDLGGFETLI